MTAILDDASIEGRDDVYPPGYLDQAADHLLQHLQEEEDVAEALLKQQEDLSINPAIMQTKERVFTSTTIKQIQGVQYASNLTPLLRTISYLK